MVLNPFFSASDFMLSPITLKKGLERVSGVYAIIPCFFSSDDCSSAFFSADGEHPVNASIKVVDPINRRICFILFLRSKE